MNKKNIFGILLSLTCIACTQDETTSFYQNDIDYSVVSTNLTRTAQTYSNIVKPSSFKVWAKVQKGGLYIDGDEIVQSGSNSWSDNTATRYWPENQKLDFFAQVGGDDCFSYDGTAAPIFSSFKVNEDVSKQVDLMYAVKTGCDKDGGTVNINFRHALSQVCFKVKTSQSMKVVVSSIGIGHVANKSTYTLPTTDTYGNNPAQGSWAAIDAANYVTTPYTVTLNSPVTVSPGNTVDITSAASTTGSDNALTLLPQTTTAWNPATKGSSTNNFNGAYFLVKAELFNVSGTSETSITNGVKEMAIPVNIAWGQGIRYVYTLTFGEGGNGAYTNDAQDPKPILTNVEYGVSVEDFKSADPSASYTLTYNANGGTGAVESVTGLTVVLSDGSGLAKEGYTFAGWATTATASTANYAAGSSITLTANTTLYAVWKRIENSTETPTAQEITHIFTHSDVEGETEINTCEYSGTDANTGCIFDSGSYKDGYNADSKVGGNALWGGSDGKSVTYKIENMEKGSYYVYFQTRNKQNGNITVQAGSNSSSLANGITKSVSGASKNGQNNTTWNEFGPYSLNSGTNYVKITWGSSVVPINVQITNVKKTE